MYRHSTERPEELSLLQPARKVHATHHEIHVLVLGLHQLHTGAVSSFHTAYNVSVFPLIPVRLLTLTQSVYVADVALEDVLHHLNVYHVLVNVLPLSVQFVSYVQVVLSILPAHQFLLYAI